MDRCEGQSSNDPNNSIDKLVSKEGKEDSKDDHTNCEEDPVLLDELPKLSNVEYSTSFLVSIADIDITAFDV